MKKIFFSLIFSFLLIFALSSINIINAADPKMIPDIDNNFVPDRGRYKLGKAHTKSIVIMNYTGDIMVHSGQIKSADRGNYFDFAPSFMYIDDIVSESDYSVCNLETTLAGAYKGRKYGKLYKGFSGYPTFNCPDVMAKNLKDAGFDMLLLANNHTLDSKLSGLNTTIDKVELQGLDHIGTRKSANEKPYIIKKINGISFAMTDYTYAMNGFNLKKENAYAINHLNNYDKAYIDKMIVEVSDMVAQGADMNIVYMHFGSEYSDYPSEKYQKSIVRRLYDAGVDVVIGAHPHVLQPFELSEHNGKQKFVAYSLGNFISSQMNSRTKKPTDFGGVLQLQFEKVDNLKPEITKVSFTPTYCLKNSVDYYILPVLETPNDFYLTNYDKRRIKHCKDVVLKRVTSKMKQDYVIDGDQIVFNLK